MKIIRRENRMKTKQTIKQELVDKGVSADRYYALRRTKDGITGMLVDEPRRYCKATNTGGRRLICN